MKQSLPLSSAVLFERAAHGPLSAAELAHHATAPAASGLAAALPAQAADVLLAHGRIRDPRFYPEGPRDCLWIAERDWIYRLELPAATLAELASAPGRRVFLHCLGLDTLADLYLDGQLIAESRDMYLPLRVDITEKLRARPADSAAPVLLVHFHSPHAWIATQPLPAAWEGRVHANRLLRKPHEDFNSFNGAFPYFTPTGIYDEVRIEIVDTAELVHLDIEQRLDTGHTAADLVITAELAGALSAAPRVRFTVHAPDGAVVASAEATAAPGATSTATAHLRVESPALWWPLGYGDQPLYEITAELISAATPLDRLSRRIGLREFTLGSDFHLRVNGVPVKLWGANLAPLEQFSHVWPADRVSRLLDHVVNAHCVTLRLWGPGAPYGDNLYDECDRRGILVWSEFYHTWGMYPDTHDYYALCRSEAEQQVRRLKHHASVFMWCGGNEVHMGSDLSQPGERVISRELYHAVYPEVCRRLDPSRYYHVDSPVGGAFPNDPDHGDTHGYTHFWFVRGCDYPLIMTENARWSPPALKTLRRYIPDPAAVWPEGFVSRVRHRPAPASGPGSPSSGLNNDGKVDARDIHEGGLLPPAWQRLGKDGNITNGRAGPIGDFYDTGDTPEGLIHRHGSAHALFMRREIERLRRGRPAALAAQPRRTQGHYWWRLNGTWPLIETELIDYLLEPKMAYYAFRRAQAPLLLSFEFGDRIHLWLTNDTARDASGTVRFELLRMGGGAPVQVIERRFTAVAGRSDIVTDLDALGMFRRDLILSARFLADDGAVLADTTDFAYQERNMIFPDARLSLRAAGPDTLAISTDTFARCVELQGTAPDGDAFGWDFEDNFFDLRPGEEKRVRLRGRHRHGTLTARGFFCTTSASLLR